MDTIGPLTFNAVVSGSPPQHQHEHHGAGASGSTCACSLSEEGAPIIAPLDTLEQANTLSLFTMSMSAAIRILSTYHCVCVCVCVGVLLAAV